MGSSNAFPEFKRPPPKKIETVGAGAGMRKIDLHFRCSRGRILRSRLRASIDARIFISGWKAAVFLIDSRERDEFFLGAEMVADFVVGHLAHQSLSPKEFLWLFRAGGSMWDRFEIGGGGFMLHRRDWNHHGAINCACNFLEFFNYPPIEMVQFAMSGWPVTNIRTR